MRPVYLLFCIFILSIQPTFAQQPDLALVPAVPAAVAPPPESHSGRAGACLQSEKDRKLKGTDLIDDRQVCFAEGRLDCIKQAVGKHIYGPTRQDFIKSCFGS